MNVFFDTSAFLKILKRARVLFPILHTILSLGQQAGGLDTSESRTHPVFWVTDLFSWRPMPLHLLRWPHLFAEESDIPTIEEALIVDIRDKLA